MTSVVRTASSNPAARELPRLSGRHACGGSLFGAHRGSVTLRDGVELTAPVLDDELDAETGRETARLPHEGADVERRRR